MDKAIWIEDYDIREDKMYKAVGCPYCEEPLHRDADIYYCACCGNDIEVDDKDMLEWLDKRTETKVEYEDCSCGGKQTMKNVFTRNPVTMKWQRAYGECLKCGMKYII